MFHQKDYIYAVYKEKSFVKAAEKLHISQPSLSASVAKEECLLGQKIFDRKTNPLTVTPFGQEYIRAVEQLLEIEGHLQELSYEYHNLQSGKLSIAASNLAIPYNVPKVIAKYKMQFPMVDLQIVETSTAKAKSMLDSGELDILITSRPLDEKKYVRIQCDEEYLIWAVPKTFPVNEELRNCRLLPDEVGKNITNVPESRAVTAKVFAQTPFILLQDTNYLRLCADIIFQESGVEPRVVLEFDHSTVSYNFASMGLGATIFSNRLAEGRLNDDRLCYYKIKSQYSRRAQYLCYSRSRYLTEAMRMAVEMFSHLQDQ